MKDYYKCEVLSRMYRERNQRFEDCVKNALGKEEYECKQKLERILKEIKSLSEEKYIDLWDSISELCSINCEAYYKIGIADGVKLDYEIKKQIEKFL